MSLFQFNDAEILTFFAVLVRLSVLFSILPFLGDGLVPMPVKILFSVACSIVLYPALVARGTVKPYEAWMWARTTSGIATTIALEVLCALAVGFTARLTFDAINFGANLVGTFMGFSAASIYDHQQESQSQVVAQFQMALAMLLFLAMDGHHLMLRGALESYRWVGVGKAHLDGGFARQMIEVTGQVVRVGIQLAAPVAVTLFAVNVAFGVVARAVPQMNILVLSFSVSALVGLIVLFLGLPEFQTVTGSLFERVEDWMVGTLAALGRGT